MTAAAVITPWGIIQSKSSLPQANSPEAGFMAPPASAKPHTWWHWMNGNVTKAGITLDLESMARVGIGGFQNFDAGTGIPKGPIVYLSPEWLELKKHAIAEAQRLGLEFTMHNCPGWSSSGGPWITPELAMQEIKYSEITIEGGKQVNVKLPKPETKLDYYKDICVLAFPAVNGKVEGWEKRANFAFNRYGVDDIPADAPAISEIDILDVTQHLQPDGQFVWGPYTRGQWTIVRFGYSAIGTENRSAPDTGVGLECDKYSAAAFGFHFNKMMENLLPFLQPLGKNGKVGLLIDSYEVGMQNWTPGFEKIFKEKNGYEINKFLPAMTGRVVGNADLTNRFLWDLRRTQGTLMADNYYGKFTELCHKNNIISYIQPYDRGPMEEMQIGARIDINVGEFWQNLSSIFQNNWTMRRTVKLSAAIAHTNGQKVVAAEAFTSEPESGKWQEHPFSLKVQGDRMFTQGLNRMVFHRFAHQPHPTAKPGMTMGPWGSHFDRTNTWWEQGKAWMTYLSRCQYLLQSGTFIADIAYFTGEDAGVYTRVERNEVVPTPPEGIDYDLINSETLLNKAKVVDKQLVLDSGTSYKILSIQDFRTMSVRMLSKIIGFQKAGLAIIGEKPMRTPGLMDDENEFKKLIDQLTFDGSALSSLKKDFSFTSRSGDAPITWIHRKIDGGDVYFLANQRRSLESVVCSFRIGDKQPEIWDPVTGSMNKVTTYNATDGVVTVPIIMQPSGSLFVVFRNPAENNPIISVLRDGASIINTTPYNTTRKTYPDTTNNFTISALAKPENSIMTSINNFMDGQQPWTDWYAVYPSPGEKLYGEGHSTFGLAIGRNGVAVWENSKGKPVFNFAAEKFISGWTKVELIVKDGVPSIHINGEFIKQGTKSAYIVHPGIGHSYLNEGASYFNGDLETEVETDPISNHGSDIVAYANGKYTLIHKTGKPVTTSVENRNVVDLSDNWMIDFPADSGTPGKIDLPKLQSLHTHAINGVKYFSGTSTYTKSFKGFKKGKKSKRYVLDLGAVEVIAEIFINNIPLGIFWTRPFVVDITDHIQEGDNKLVIHVTNLWPNRLIGDEQEPAVYKYAPGAGGKGFASLSGGAIQELPEWYKKNQPKPDNGRVAFATWQHYTKESPLLQSGLIGPVVIREGTIISH
jgi:hypothetical protein